MTTQTRGRETHNRRGTHAAGAAGPPAPAGADHPLRWLVLIGLVMAAVMEVMDTTIVNVALPQMAGNLNATSDEIAWVSTGYLLSNVVVLPMTAWLSQRLGRKRYLSGSVIAFVAASLLCGVSHSLIEVVLWRVLQGGAGAALISTAQATLAEIFPARQQGAVQGIFGLGLGVGPTVGPLIGGWLTDNYSWSWCFFINLPIGIAALFLIGAFLRDAPASAGAPRQSIDWAGIGLLAVGLGSLQYVLEEGKRLEWFDSRLIVALSVTSAVTLAALIVWELWPTNRHPVVDLRVYRDRGLAVSVALSFAQGFSLFGVLFLFPLFAQNVLGFTPTQTGIVLLPQGLVIAAAIGSSTAAMGKGVDPRPVILGGLAVGAVGLWLMGHLTGQSGADDSRTALLFEGFGVGYLFIPLTLTAFAGLRGAQVATGSALLGLGRQIGGSVGIAFLNTWVGNSAAAYRADLVGHLYAGRAQTDERLAALAHGYVAHGYGMAQAKSLALGAVDGAVQAQATVLAYENAFLVAGSLFVFFLPLVLLLKKGDGRTAGPAH